MKRAVLGLVLFSTLASTPVFAADSAVLDRVLGGVEWKADRTALKLLGPDADAQLIDVINDEATAPMRRRRAILLLEAVKSPTAETFLRERFARLRDAKDGSPALEVATLLPVMARMHLVDYDAARVFLAHPIANLRESAAVALMTIDATNARGLLRQRLQIETDSGVRAQLVRQLDTKR